VKGGGRGRIRSGHAENIDKMRNAIDHAVIHANEMRLDLAGVLGWLGRTGYTGYYSRERDQAAQWLLDARDEARKLTQEIDRALARMRSI
jgi:hypothetical protein